MALAMACGKEPAGEPLHDPAAALGSSLVPEDPRILQEDYTVGATITPEDEAESQRPAAPGEPQIVYLNYSDGTTVITRGPDNAPMNRSSICGTAPKTYPKYLGSDAKKHAEAAWYSDITKDYNMIVTTVRPTKGPYEMVMIGPGGNGCGDPGSYGQATLDCGNRNPSSVSFSSCLSG